MLVGRAQAVPRLGNALLGFASRCFCFCLIFVVALTFGLRIQILTVVIQSYSQVSNSSCYHAVKASPVTKSGRSSSR